MIPFDEDVRVMSAGNSRSCADVVFLGGRSNFSGSLISATRQELGNISAAALNSVGDLYALFDTRPLTPEVVIVDEPTLAGLCAAERARLLSLPVGSMGVAFSTLPFGINCYEEEDLRDISASIFPLNVRLDVWLSIIRMIAYGGSYVSPEVTAAQRISAPEPKLVDSGLTERQLDVLSLVADGYSNKRIADRLGLSVHTVKLHLHNANLRLGARNRTEAAMRFRAMKQ